MLHPEYVGVQRIGIRPFPPSLMKAIFSWVLLVLPVSIVRAQSAAVEASLPFLQSWVVDGDPLIDFCAQNISQGRIDPDAGISVRTGFVKVNMGPNGPQRVSPPPPPPRFAHDVVIGACAVGLGDVSEEFTITDNDTASVGEDVGVVSPL